MKAKFDFLFLGILGLLIGNTIIHSYLFNYLLSINNYLGFGSWVIVLVLRLVNTRLGRYGTALLLILGTLNILNFGLGTVSLSFSIGNIDQIPTEPVGLDPVILLILIIYYFTNKKTVNRILSDIFYGNSKEQIQERQKKVEFYLEKFENYNSVEFDKILQSLKDYPIEAQIAIKEIRDQKESKS
jgi:hypothetical protein